MRLLLSKQRLHTHLTIKVSTPLSRGDCKHNCNWASKKIQFKIFWALVPSLLPKKNETYRKAILSISVMVVFERQFSKGCNKTNYLCCCKAVQMNKPLKHVNRVHWILITNGLMDGGDRKYFKNMHSMHARGFHSKQKATPEFDGFEIFRLHFSGGDLQWSSGTQLFSFSIGTQLIDVWWAKSSKK